ncbi:hypothetical protein TNCV_3811181 [Trichonephila clavipes]|nr:hypothetical protein TNCV_3811181 [Trichonephila clavipes]
MVLHLGGKFLSFLAWLRAKRLLSDWMLGTMNIDSDWLPRGLRYSRVVMARTRGRLCRESVSSPGVTEDQQCGEDNAR